MVRSLFTQFEFSVSNQKDVYLDSGFCCHAHKQDWQVIWEHGSSIAWHNKWLHMGHSYSLILCLAGSKLKPQSSMVLKSRYICIYLFFGSLWENTFFSLLFIFPVRSWWSKKIVIISLLFTRLKCIFFNYLICWFVNLNFKL